MLNNSVYKSDLIEVDDSGQTIELDFTPLTFYIENTSQDNSIEMRLYVTPGVYGDWITVRPCRSQWSRLMFTKVQIRCKDTDKTAEVNYVIEGTPKSQGC